MDSFPIMHDSVVKKVPWSLMAPHWRQARRNHGGQSLEELASRGGLSTCEAVAVIEGRPWQSMDECEARSVLLLAVVDMEYKRG